MQSSFCLSHKMIFALAVILLILGLEFLREASWVWKRQAAIVAHRHKCENASLVIMTLRRNSAEATLRMNEMTNDFLARMQERDNLNSSLKNGLVVFVNSHKALRVDI